MTSPAGFIDFFVLEASEYVEQLDALMLRAAAGQPDGEAMQRTARALRGSATMAKLPAFAELAAAIEGIGRATRDGVIPWNDALRGAMIAAVDDLKFLVRGARTWGDAEVQRATARTRELIGFAPAMRRASTAAPAQGGNTFLVGEANNIAAGLELLATRPDDRDAAVNVLGRVRALRGFAGLKDVPGLGDVVEGAEIAAHPLELGQGGLSLERVEVLRAAAALLRRIATALRDAKPADGASAEADRFSTALDALDAAVGDAERIVPIASLFFDDAGPHVVSAAPNPPTTLMQRFTLEVVSLGEHLGQLVGDARAAGDAAAQGRARRALRRLLRSIADIATSFGQADVADFARSMLEGAAALDPVALDKLGALSVALSAPGADGERLRQRVVELRMSSAPTPVVSPAVPAPSAPTPVAAPVVPAPAPAVTALDEGIASLDAFAATPFAEPVPVEADIVPIEALLYRGRAAVQRAIEIRDEIRRAGAPPSPEVLDELFELLDLALAE
jgi:hypothetical protein